MMEASTRTRLIVPALALLAALLFPPAAISGPAVGTAFTYQGELTDEAGNPVTAGTARLVFRLWDGLVDGGQFGPDCVVYPVSVQNGIFSVQVDFGQGVDIFNGQMRYLEIGADLAGGTSYTWLAPRQPVTATPYALYALNGGDGPWAASGSGIFYTGGNVGIGETNPWTPLTVTGDLNGPVLYAEHYGDSYDSGSAIYGQFGGGDGYGVHGRISGGDNWSAGVFGETNSERAFGVYARNTSTASTGTAIYGGNVSSSGAAVVGWNEATTGQAIGIRGYSASPTGFGGYFSGRGHFSKELGIGTQAPTAMLDVVGKARVDTFQLDDAPVAGYVLTSDAEGIGTWQPSGTGSGLWSPGTGGAIYYNGGRVGVNLTNPQYDLHVAGGIAGTLVQASGVSTYSFKMNMDPYPGHVMTSDASGNASWAPPGSSEILLPVDELATTDGASFMITNHSTASAASAIKGVLGSVVTSSEAAAGEFDATAGGGIAVKAWADDGMAIYAGLRGDGGTVIRADGSNAYGGGHFSSGRDGGYGVRGRATSTGASTATVGGWFESAGQNGRAVLAQASGFTATAIEAEASGGQGVALRATAQEGTAVVAESQSVGLVAHGAVRAASFFGNVAIYEHGTSTKVMELGKGLDYAEGFDVSELDLKPQKGEVLVIDPVNPGRLTRSATAYDRKVAGIVAGADGLGSGVRLGGDTFDLDVALAGRVYCNVIARGEAIQPGDLLTTSDVPGCAMKVADHVRAQGAILGKAMEPLPAGKTGRILVLVTLQ